MLGVHGDAKGALFQFAQARKRFSKLKLRIVACELEILDAIAHQMEGEGTLSIQSLEQRIRAMDSNKGLFLSRLAGAPVYSLILSAKLDAVTPAAHRFIGIARNTGLANTEGSGLYLQANAALQSYHLDEALQGFQKAIEKRDIVHRKIAIEIQVGLVLTYQALQRSEDAANAMQRLMQFALETEAPQQIAVAQSCQARLSLLQGDSKQALKWACSFTAKAHSPSMLMWLETPVLTQLRVMVAAEGSHECLQQASESLTALFQSVRAVRNTYQMIEILVLQCVALHKLERADEAIEVLQQLITLAQPGGWIRPFVELGQPMAELLSRFIQQKGSSDYLRRVFEHCSTRAEPLLGSPVAKSQFFSSSEFPILEHLTKREFEILELLAQRFQNKEIAAQLFISPETVKYHLKHLYQKLYVNNRRDAVIKAGEIKAAGADLAETR